MFSKLFKKKQVPVVLDENAPIQQDGVLTQNFGIRIYDGSVAPFAKIGEAYPCSKSLTFSTSEDNQDQITLFFFRGVDSQAQNCNFLGECRLRGFEPGPAKEPLVRLHFRLGDDKIELWAEDENNNNEIYISIVKNADGISIH